MGAIVVLTLSRAIQKTASLQISLNTPVMFIQIQHTDRLVPSAAYAQKSFKMLYFSVLGACALQVLC